MKQVIQNYRTGILDLAEVPIPLCSSDTVLVRNVASLVSIGTERSVIELARKSLLGKARGRPDLVRRFVDKARKEGVAKTFHDALNILDNPTPLGYSCAGIVVAVGENIHIFSPGDRVSCIGAGYASHAEYLTVPEKLCCKIPDAVTFEEASFGMLGIIALHGIHCARLTFGTSVAVIGLGLLGLLTVQILKAYGCRVIGTDIDPSKCGLARKLGADLVVEGSASVDQSASFTGGMGVDAVILTVTTKSDDPLHTAVKIVRHGGKIVVVGVADIHPQRNEMWHNEVEIIVSKAGGPGTFDPWYEKKGVDYPIGYVRWTENRNLEEFLRLIAEKRVDVDSLISHRFGIDQAETVYGDIMQNRGGPHIGVILGYPKGDSLHDDALGKRTIFRKAEKRPVVGAAAGMRIGVIGAGLFGKTILLPVLKRMPDIILDTIATFSSANAYHTAGKCGFEKYTTDYREVIENTDINAVLILTPHSLHAGMVTEAMQAGKHVFVEKPLCITAEELHHIKDACTEAPDRILMVGYNRRFSPHAARMAGYLGDRRDPMVVHYRVNAGFVPFDHWVHSEEEGGSRVIGEACHFLDFIQFLTKSYPVRVFAERVSGNNRTVMNSDNVAVTIKFEDGSIGNIIYTASGDKAFSREQIEIYCEGSTIVSTDYKQTRLYRKGRKKSFKTISQDMGYKEELRYFADLVLGKRKSLIPVEELLYSTQAAFAINASLDTNEPVVVRIPG